MNDPLGHMDEFAASQLLIILYAKQNLQSLQRSK